MKAELQIQNNNPIDHNTTGLKGVNEDTTTDELLELMYGSKEESVTPDDAWLEEYLDTTPEPKQANTSHITHGADMVFDDTPKKLGLCNDAIQKHTPTPIAKAVKEAALIPVYHGFIFDGQDKSIKSNETIKDIFDNYITNPNFCIHTGITLKAQCETIFDIQQNQINPLKLMINPIEKELGIAVMRNELAVLENEKEAETKPDLKATIEISIKAKQLEIDTAIKASPELTEMNDVLKGMKANKDRLKKDLGGFYTVIINKTIRAAEPENRLSGFMVFDYDVFDLDYAAIKKSLKPISYIQGFFPSPSGGLKVIIATDLNGSNTDKKLFGYAYDAVFADLTERGIDLEFDQAGKDNQYQICYFAYDEHAYFNNDVIPFKYVNKAKALVADEQAEYAKNQLKYQNVKSDDIEFNEIVEMVNQLNTNGWHYNDYLNDVAFGFINDFGEEGKRFAIQFCNQRYGKQGNMGYDWQKMLGDKTPSTATLRKNKGTLIKACKSQGIERKSKSDKVKEAKRKITEKQHELAEKKLNQHEYKTFDTANEIAEIEEEIEATEQKVVELSKTTHDIVYELMQQLDFSSDDIIEKINKINSLQDNINSVDTSNYAVIEKLDEMMDDEKRDVLYMQWNLVQLEKMANHDPKSTAFNKIRVATGNLVSKERKKLETDTKARNFIGGLDGFCYVSDLDRYVFYVDNRWVKMTKEAFKHHYTILKDKMLYETFDNMRPSKIYVTYTFNDALPNTMNLMREQDWVKPDLTATDFNENFDGLFNSLAGGKAENKTHIERVVVWKYLYPEDYTIPSLNFSGAGNIGKNIFVEKMLGNLFNKEQVKTVKLKIFLGILMMCWRVR